MINASLTSGTVPVDTKHVVVYPRPKKASPDSSIVASYRLRVCVIDFPTSVRVGFLNWGGFVSYSRKTAVSIRKSGMKIAEPFQVGNNWQVHSAFTVNSTALCHGYIR
jgi:hypothetical protein